MNIKELRTQQVNLNTTEAELQSLIDEEMRLYKSIRTMEIRLERFYAQNLQK